jgi:hypothetical protein
LESCSPKEREVTTAFIPISRKHLAIAKEKIRLFRDEMVLLAQSESAEDVYALAIQMFPLTNKN